MIFTSRDGRAVGDITEYIEPSNNVRGYIARAVTGGCVLGLILLLLPLLLLPSALLGRWMCQGFLRWWNQQLSRRQARWLAVDAAIGRPAAWLGACLGVYSHLFLDALMHLDAEPWAPFSSANPFLGIVSVTQLNVLCAWSLLAGVAWLVIARFWPRDAI